MRARRGEVTEVESIRPIWPTYPAGTFVGNVNLEIWLLVSAFLVKQIESTLIESGLTGQSILNPLRTVPYGSGRSLLWGQPRELRL